jgi:hypothetical protein
MRAHPKSAVQRPTSSAVFLVMTKDFLRHDEKKHGGVGYCRIGFRRKCVPHNDAITADRAHQSLGHDQDLEEEGMG